MWLLQPIMIDLLYGICVVTAHRQTMHPSLFFDLFRAAGGIPPPPGMMGMPNNGAPVAGSGGLSSTSASAGVAPHVPHTMPLHGNGNNTGMGPMGGMAGMPQYGYGAPASVGGAAYVIITRHSYITYISHMLPNHVSYVVVLCVMLGYDI